MTLFLLFSPGSKIILMIFICTEGSMQLCKELCEAVPQRPLEY